MSSAGAKLDAYIRKVQAIVTRYEGHVVDVTMADKGGYLFAAFGALHAHEDDAQRSPGGAGAALVARHARKRSGTYWDQPEHDAHRPVWRCDAAGLWRARGRRQPGVPAHERGRARTDLSQARQCSRL